MKKVNCLKFTALSAAIMVAAAMLFACDNIQVRRRSDETEPSGSEETSETSETSETTEVPETTETSETTETTETTEPTESSAETEPSESEVQEELLPYDVYLSYNFSSDGTKGYSFSDQLLKLAPTSAERYPELNAALEEFNSGFDQEAVNEKLHELCEKYEANKGRYSREIIVKRADDELLSFICQDIYSEEYTEDKSKFYLINLTGINFDVKTGKLLEVGDMFTDDKFISDFMVSTMGDGYNMSEQLSNGGLSIAFEPETVMFLVNDEDGRLAGEYFLGLDEVQGLDQKYIPTSEDYITNISNRADSFATAQVAKAGANRIYVNGIANNNGDYTKLKIEMTDAEFNTIDLYESEDFWAFELSTSLVKLDGKYYIYIECGMEDDYCETYIFSVNGKKIEFLDTQAGSFTGLTTCVDNPYGFDMDEQGAEFTVCCLPTRIDALEHCFRCDLLGTYDVVYNTVFVDGVPVRAGSTFGIALTDWWYTPLKSIKSFDAIELETGNEITIEAGQLLKLTDADVDQSRVILCDEEGRSYIVEIDTEEYPRTINGVPEDELFETIYYAG